MTSSILLLRLGDTEAVGGLHHDSRHAHCRPLGLACVQVICPSLSVTSAIMKLKYREYKKDVVFFMEELLFQSEIEPLFVNSKE